MNTKQTTREEYLKRLNIVIEHINRNLGESIDLKTLSEISNFSEYHFHRIFKAFIREPLGTYITRLRLERAAHELRYSEMTIEEIAYKVGYEVPSSLSKSFKQLYGISPKEYRADKNFFIMRKIETNPEPSNPVITNPLDTNSVANNPMITDSVANNPMITNPVVNQYSDCMLKKPKICELNSKRAIYIRLNGAYSNLDFPGTFAKLWSYVKERKLFSAGIEHIGIYHNDPKVTEVEKLRSDVCLVICKPAEPHGEIGVKDIAGGKYAIFSYHGPYSNLGVVYDTIFSKWLPESGEQLRDQPLFEKYVSDPARTEPAKLKTEIYVPLK